MYRNLSSRTRRPDRAVYVPRAKRSQTTPPSTTNQKPQKPLKKSVKTKSKSIDENNSSEDTFEELINDRLAVDCDDNSTSDDEKNHKNITNYSTMSDKSAITIESAGGIEQTTEKIDKDEKELMKASQEINRSNRKLIKQTFNSNVLEIEATNGDEDEKAVSKDEDDWDTL